MPSDLPPFSLRIPPELMAKLKVIASYNKRSVNKEIEFLIEQYVWQWEQEHGEINISQEDN